MRLVRWLAGIAIVLFLALVAGVLGLNAWLDSAGGRATLERQLSAAAGVPVLLPDDFDVVLWPPVGASGSDLRVLDSVGGEVVARSRSFSIELAPRPLINRELRAESVRLEWLALGPPGGASFAVPKIEISGFEPGRATGLQIDLGLLGEVSGFFSWFPRAARVDLDLRYSVPEHDDIDLVVSAGYGAESIGLDDLAVRIGGQRLSGQGCVLLGGPELNLSLEAETLDLEALMNAVPSGPGTPSAGLPLEINLSLEAKTLYRGGVRAEDAVFELGAPPRCP